MLEAVEHGQVAREGGGGRGGQERSKRRKLAVLAVVYAAALGTIAGLPSVATSAHMSDIIAQFTPAVEERVLQEGPDAAQLQREDRMAEAVHVMPGGRTVEGTLFMDANLTKEFFACEDRLSLCRVPEQLRHCEWCSHEACIEGELHANRANLVWHHTTNQRSRLQGAARAFAGREPVDPENPTTDVLLFSCHVKEEIPMNAVGNFTLFLPLRTARVGQVVMSRRLARKPMLAPPGSVATCGRATYGDVSADAIVRVSEYLRFHGFGSLYLYNAGSTTVLNPMKLENYLARLAEDNSIALRYLDMRNHLDTLFGSSADYAFLSSHAGGQEWTKYECALRARRDGHDWILHTDLDEYIFPGKAMIKEGLMMPMAERLKHQVARGQDGFSIGSVMAPCDGDMSPEMEWPLDLTESRERWEAYMRRTAKRYVEVVLKDPLNHFSINNGHARQAEGNACDDYRWCPGGAGTRKLFMRSAFPPIRLRVHHTSGRSIPAMNADQLHLEHYKCINAIKPSVRLLAFPAPVNATSDRQPAANSTTS